MAVRVGKILDFPRVRIPELKRQSPAVSEFVREPSHRVGIVLEVAIAIFDELLETRTKVYWPGHGLQFVGAANRERISGMGQILTNALVGISVGNLRPLMVVQIVDAKIGEDGDEIVLGRRMLIDEVQ